MLSDTDPLLTSCSGPYQLGLKCFLDQDHSKNTGIIFPNCGLSPMEDSLSSALSRTPRLDRSQDAMNINSQASIVDETEGCVNADVEKLAEPVQNLRPTSKEFKKTWGFRRTTIAQREMPGDADKQNGRNALIRHNCRQAQSISASKRGRSGRKSASASLGNPKPPSQRPTDPNTPSEASITISSAVARTTDEAADCMPLLVGKISSSVSVSEGTSSDQADSEDLTLKELQDLLKKRHKKDSMGPNRGANSLRKEDAKSGLDKPVMPEAIKSLPRGTSAEVTSQDTMSTHETTDSRAGKKPILNSEEEEDLPGRSDKGHCPDTLYCICRRKHNNRYMVCCDCCKEWFHGDCVGITEACDQLLERNREGYTCPNCTLQKSQAAAAESSEGDKQATSEAEVSPSSCQTILLTGMEKNHAEDQGIKGKIERTTNPCEKKKMKIFNPVEETSTLPKCIGPGCGKRALRDSVYCGTECILKHAAAAVKSLARAKEPTPKPQSQKKLASETIVKGRKRSFPETTRRRSLESCSTAEEDNSSSEEETVVEQDRTASLWANDHKCITVNPEKTTAIPSAVFYKSSGKEGEEIEGKKGSAQLQQNSSLSFTFPRGNKKTPILGDPPSKRTKVASQPVNCDGESTLPPSKCPTSSKRSLAPALASQPSCPPTSEHHTLDVLRLSKTAYNVPSELPQQQNLPLAFSPSPGLAPAAPSRPPQAQPNITIRHNIRQSLAEILYKRVSDSDDLEMPERNVGRLAVSIEKEMYNLFLNTEQSYKNKYRSIMFNLKDPNKRLFSQVLRGDVTPFKLVRLNPEELLSEDIAGRMYQEEAEILKRSPKAEAVHLERGQKRVHSPCADMEESPPISDGDLSMSVTSSLPCIASAPDWSPTPPTVNSRQPNVISPVTDLFCKMLSDTTAEHRMHLFNLNCKICTGQISAEEAPIPKKVKNFMNKKADSKVKRQSRNSKVRDYSGDDSSDAPLDSEMYIMESPASPDDASNTVSLSEPITIPAVPSIVIAGRDPRTASYRPPISVTSTAPTMSSIFESGRDITPVLPQPPPPPPPVPKSILLKPTSSDLRFFSTCGSSSSIMDSHSPPGGHTAQFLSKQEVLWKGFINMYSVAKIVTKSYLVSGSVDYLKEDLPDTIQIGGRISPDTVWDYVAKIKTSCTKELCLIRFHPASEEEEVAYISLFSYFNSRGRFGVVANNSRHIKDLYLIPLGAKAPVPSKLVPIEGPGLETNHPNLLLGLAICQKPKCSGTLQGEEDEEKCSEFQTGHSDDTRLPTLPALSSSNENPDKQRMYNPEILISTTPPGSPSSVSSSDSSSSSFSTSLLLHKLKPLKASEPSTINSGTESSSPCAASITPLQTILKTLFGTNKLDSHASQPSMEQDVVKMEMSPAPLVDPIVQQFGQISEKKLEEDVDNRGHHPEEEFNLGIASGAEKGETDRPYDPEEEFNPGVIYGVEKHKDDRPYDPEEEYNPEMTCGVEEDEDDRPYDPEEEYNPGMTYGVEEDQDDRPYDPEEEYNVRMDYGMEPVQKNETNKISKAFSDDEVAYDPEDETMFEEVKGNVTDNPHQMERTFSPEVDSVSGSESLTLTEQQKMLEELNKQIEEHKRQLAEQEEALRQQRAAVGVSLAHFSVSDALMSPPLKPLLTNFGLRQLKKNEDLAKTPAASVVNQRRDPRQSKDPQQAGVNEKQTFQRLGKDSDGEVTVEHRTSLKIDHISQSPMVTPPEPIYLDAGSSDISITPLEEKIDPRIQPDFLRGSAPEQKNKKTSEAQIESWQNSTSVLKDKELSSHQSNQPKQFQTLSEPKPIQIPYCSILRNKTGQQSSDLPGMEESDQLHFCDSSKFQPTFHCRPSQNQRGEKMLTDNLCRHTPSAKDPLPSSPMDLSPEFDRTWSSLLPNNIGQRGPSPGRVLEGNSSPPPVDVHDSHRQSPSFSFSASRGPHIRQIDHRSSQLSNFHGSRGHPHNHQFIDHRPQIPMLGTPGFPDDQECNSISYQPHMEKNKGQTSHIYRDIQGSSRRHYSHPFGEIRGQRFRPPQDFGPPRVPSPHLQNHRVPLSQYRGSFENQEGPPLSKQKRQLGFPPTLFGVPEDNQDNFTDSGGQLKLSLEGQVHMLDQRPLRRSGPLLPTPTEGPILLHHHVQNRLDYHNKDWRQSPETRSCVKGDLELHNNGNKTRIFGDYNHYELQVPSHLSPEGQQGFFEARREWDASHSRVWDRNSSKYRNREWDEWECNRGREVQKHRNGDDNDERDSNQDHQRDRVWHRDWNWRDRDRSRIRDRNKGHEFDRYFREGRRVQSRSRDCGRHRDRDHGTDKGRDIEKDRNWAERSKRKEKDKEP